MSMIYVNSHMFVLYTKLYQVVNAPHDVVLDRVRIAVFLEKDLIGRLPAALGLELDEDWEVVLYHKDISDTTHGVW